MRDILNDLEAGKQLSDPDPVRRAQIQMKTPLPKRFYKAVSVVPVESGFAVHPAPHIASQRSGPTLDQL